MYKGKRTLAIITARGGSKGIPRKNIKDLCGKPLIAYTVFAAKASKYLTRTILSTDDQEITNVAKNFGVDVPFMRPVELATDEAKSMDVVQHALRELAKSGETYNYLMILQPTSPMRTSDDIDACIEKIVDTDADSVMSMFELIDFSAKKMKKIENDLILPYFEEEGVQSARRQDIAKMYKRNCAIYLTKVSCIEAGDLFGKISRPYVMPEDRSVDINKSVDFELAEFWMQKKLSSK